MEKLLKIRYETDTPTVMGTRFYCEASEKEVIAAGYYPRDEWEFCETQHTPADPALWRELEETLAQIFPKMSVVQPKKQPRRDPGIRILDGGDYRRIYLTFEGKDGPETKQYTNPDDRRILTVTALLHELAEPIGREIPRYEPPELTGVYLSAGGYSYQCTAFGGGHRYIVYDGSVRIDRMIPEQDWRKIRAYLGCFDWEQMSREGEDGTAVTLYYSDGKQPRYKKIGKTAESIRAFLRALDPK